ncbi:DUF4352 domain-containing protein [Ectobacillus panaciterrae]|uniref:DUF4352 domain-containing protein n=1 Tax=Ectobacillus panaciterrae TaxID=363872 RepID=UPI0004072214|nr:DUF4352 domain-containing protein [Ectobacillus panaciterrae]
MKMFLVAFVIICGLTGCVQDGAKKIPLPEIKTHNIHETASIEKVAVSVRKIGTPSSYEIWKAKEGYMFLIFQVSIANHLNTSLLVMPRHFNLVSSTGKIYGVFQTTEYSGLLHKTKIRARGTAEGILLFEVPRSETYKELIFAPIKNEPLIISLK